MPVFTTPGMVETMRLFCGGALDETYTRIPIVPVADGGGAPVLDGWGQQQTESGAPETGLACRLGTVELVVRDERGAMLVRRPYLWVPHDARIAAGDLVTEVRDRSGRLLLGQAAVVRVEPTPVGVGTITTAVELDGAEAIPLPAPAGG
jgi:hypothetical protein